MVIATVPKIQTTLMSITLIKSGHAFFHWNLSFHNLQFATHRSHFFKDLVESWMNFNANAAHIASSLSCLHGSNSTMKHVPLACSEYILRISFCNCRIKDDLPLPHSPSIEIVKGGCVSSCPKNSATAST